MSSIKKSSALLSIAILLTSNSYMFSGTANANSFNFFPSMESVKGTALTTAKWSTLAFIVISATRLATRWGDTSAPRYDWEKIKNFQDLPSQLFYLFDDGWIGHTGIKPYLLHNSHPERLEHIDACYPKGLLGWAHYYHKGIIKGTGVAVAIFALAKLILESKGKALTTLNADLAALSKDVPFDKFVPVAEGQTAVIKAIAAVL